MNWLRDTLKKNRIFLLALLLVAVTPTQDAPRSEP